MSPALTGGVLATGPPGKSPQTHFKWLLLPLEGYPGEGFLYRAKRFPTIQTAFYYLQHNGQWQTLKRMRNFYKKEEKEDRKFFRNPKGNTSLTLISLKYINI